MGRLRNAATPLLRRCPLSPFPPNLGQIKPIRFSPLPPPPFPSLQILQGFANQRESRPTQRPLAKNKATSRLSFCSQQPMHLTHLSTTRGCRCLPGLLRRCVRPTVCTVHRPGSKARMSGTPGNPKAARGGRDVRVQGVPGLSAGSPWQSGLGAKYPELTADTSADVVGTFIHDCSLS